MVDGRCICVTLFVALVQFGWIYSIEPEIGIMAFGAVVILTMSATEAFDTRLIWDTYHAGTQEALYRGAIDET